MKKDDKTRLKGALSGYRKAIALNPGYAEAYKNMGNLLQEKPRWRPAAVRAYHTALSLRPNSRDTLLSLGKTLGWLNQTGAANLTYLLGVERGLLGHHQQRPSHYVAGRPGGALVA